MFLRLDHLPNKVTAEIFCYSAKAQTSIAAILSELLYREHHRSTRDLSCYRLLRVVLHFLTRDRETAKKYSFEDKRWLALSSVSTLRRVVSFAFLSFVYMNHFI